MILAAHHQATTLWFCTDGIRSVSADIMERPKLAIFAEDEDETEACDGEGAVVSRFLEEGGMTDVQPGLGEDGTLLEVEQSW